MKAWQHFKTITRHRLIVMAGCFRIGLYRQGLSHDLSKSHLSTCASTLYALHADSFVYPTKKSRNPLIYKGLREVRPTGFEPATFRVGV